MHFVVTRVAHEAWTTQHSPGVCVRQQGQYTGPGFLAEGSIRAKWNFHSHLGRRAHTGLISSPCVNNPDVFPAQK